MRNVITIPPDLHDEFRVKVVTRRPKITMGSAAAAAVRLWIALQGKTPAQVVAIAKKHASVWRDAK